MICIRCKHDSKYPERKDGKKCPNCQGRFAFEPRDNDPFTDMAFQKAIDSVSALGQVKWGVEHLYYELCRKKRSTAGLTAAFIFIPSVIVLAAIFLPFALLIVIPIAIISIAALYQQSGLVAFERGTFEKMWDRWGQVHGKPKGVIARRPQEDRPARTPEPDLGDYSFDRAVICDRARTVDLLLANNFHFENNCAVLSVGGYPQQAFETVRRMLRRNPRLEVFVLHDITTEGCSLAHRLANDPEWFRGTGIRIVDVGLRPAHAGPFKGLFLRGGQDVKAGGGISSEEARWLSRFRLELAVIRPEQVIKRLFRSMNQTNLAARTFSGPLKSQAPQARLPRGASEGAATAGAVAVGAAALASTSAMARYEDPEELARQKKKEAAAQSGGDGGSGSSSSSDVGFEIDTDSFSSDADASDGGADSFG